MISKSIAALAALGLLAACGGGGSSGSPMTPGRTDGAPSKPSAMSVHAANPAEAHRATMAAATSIPAFGSVTQSSNRNASDVTTDAASASFDGTDLQLTVRRQDGSSIALDSADHTVVRQGYSPPLQGASGRTYALLDFNETSISAASVTVSWNNSDPTDYLAGGYWMHFEGTTAPLRITGVELGAFVDGPELSGAASLPNLGTATYSGDAGGLYAVRYGAGSGVPAGSTETGEFTANIALTADFANSTISGCIGCDGSGVTDHVFVDASTGQAREVSGESSESSFHLSPASIDASGRFTGTTVRWAHPDATVTSTEGSWAGQFSNVAVNGDPRLVAGTVGAQAQTSLGTEVVFVGAWYGAK